MSGPTDGGPAFPLYLINSGKYEPGMSLRDYFAAQALPCVHAEYLRAAGTPGWITRSDYEHIAADAYTLADAMLKARAVSHG